MYFKLNNDGKSYTLISCNNEELITKIPGYYNDLPVTRISYHAFTCCKSRCIELPETLTHISDEAFSECEFLETISIPEGVFLIGENAFHNCRNLKTAIIPHSVEIVGNGIFSGCDNLFQIIDLRSPILTDETYRENTGAYYTERTCIYRLITKIGGPKKWM